jgi:pyruvate formate lyase activating enzyme
MKLQVADEVQAYVMDMHTDVGTLIHAEGDRLRCVACGHRCLIAEGMRGICKVRFVRDGQLRVPFGYVSGLQCDPVEKKPYFHVLPGSDALTFGMLGCDLHCSYCQNWFTSQSLRDASAKGPMNVMTPAQLVAYARREKARLAVSSYNEPLITAEWAVAVFKEMNAAGIMCGFVSNGNATPEVLDFLRPWIKAYKIDLKGFDDRHYRTLGCPLQNVLEGIRMVHERGLWLEVVTLVIPGFNDAEAELRGAARFLASVSRDIPWHLTGYHQDYKMTDPPSTPAETLVRAAEIGKEEGLRFVYAGNRPGQVGEWENTRCPGCHETLIERYGFLVRSYRLTPEGRCPSCQTQIPGLWHGKPTDARTGDLSMYGKVMPRAVR